MSSASSTFDSFSEPYTRPADESSLNEVRNQIHNLEEQHKQNGIPLSGRIIHVCHYLPIVATYKSRTSVNGIPSPPQTPPSRSTEFGTKSEASTPVEDGEAVAAPSAAVWGLSPRYGHSAMISGIQSLSATHQQVIVGWIGDIECAGRAENVPVNQISVEDRVALEDTLKTYNPKESDPDDDLKTTHVPVWLDDKVAHGHYDGYCKQSK
jgi:trehalose 6-phosphate synthase/phosphatase